MMILILFQVLCNIDTAILSVPGLVPGTVEINEGWRGEIVVRLFIEHLKIENLTNMFRIRK